MYDNEVEPIFKLLLRKKLFLNVFLMDGDVTNYMFGFLPLTSVTL